jgi:hypothetical protein
MGKINYGRVILGGIVAGVIACLIDWFMNGVVLGQLWTDNMKRLNLPNAFAGSFTVLFILAYPIGYIIVIWLYAAVRPRLGPGVRTAVCLALALWVIGVMPAIVVTVQGIYTPRLTFFSQLIGLAETLIATIVGAALYKEAESTTAYPVASPQATH